MLKAESEKHLDDNQLSSFLNSERGTYRLFAFQNFKESHYDLYADYWLIALKNDMPITRKFIIKNIPQELWLTSKIQDKISGFFSFYDVNTRTYLLNKMEKSDFISTNSLENISNDIQLMNKNQLLLYLSLLKRNSTITKTISDNINNAKKNQSYNYSYLLNEFNF